MGEIGVDPAQRGVMPGTALSVVVPTCGRAAAVRRLLQALAVQREVPPFEVIVVADGVAAAATGVGTAAWPFEVQVIEQARAGAAAARNRGAARARGALLLFLDDDVEPGPHVVHAHVDCHAAGADAIGVGELAPRTLVTGFVGDALSGWWEAMADGLADPRHRFSFRDVLSGHCSMSSALFAASGGFDSSLKCQEDFEFGYRAIRSGIEVRYVSQARAFHFDDSDLDKILRRKFDEGVANVQLCARHPELLRALPLGRALAQARLAAAVHRGAIGRPAGHRAVPVALRSAMQTFEALSMRDKWRWALERLMDYWYWRGVVHAAGSADAVRAARDRDDAPLPPSLTVDLQEGLDLVEQRVDLFRPDSLRIMIAGECVGDLPPVPGAEPLRGVHLRPLLLKHFAEPLVAAAARAGVLPEIFRGPAVAAQGHGTTPSCAKTWRAA
ncbi:MAG TPA: glycosyltransferase [Vicinamibacterales bacterium]|nr:glycosyltransferase [Vicinamibacterales bacterium]